MSDEFSLDQQPKAAALGARFTKKPDRLNRTRRTCRREIFF
jgi:hypothetical protein